jgi:hypothetical protein
LQISEIDPPQLATGATGLGGSVCGSPTQNTQLDEKMNSDGDANWPQTQARRGDTAQPFLVEPRAKLVPESTGACHRHRHEIGILAITIALHAHTA